MSKEIFNEWLKLHLVKVGLDRVMLTDFDIAYIKWWEYEDNKDRFKFQIENECLSDSALKRIYSIEHFSGRKHSDTELVYLNQVLSSDDQQEKIEKLEAENKRLEKKLQNVLTLEGLHVAYDLHNEVSEYNTATDFYTYLVKTLRLEIRHKT